MQQFPRLEQPPGRVVVHPFAGDDDRGPPREVRRPRVDPGAPGVQRVAGAGAPGRPAEHVQLVRRGVAQRPHVRGGGQDQVDRVDGQLAGDPADRGGDAAAQVAAVPPGLPGDEGEHPLTVGLAPDQAGGAQLSEPLAEFGQALHDAVVREQPPVLQERVRVGHRVRAGAGVPDVRDEGRAVQVPGGAREGGVLPGRDRLLGHLGAAARGEGPDPGTVGVAVALRRQAIRRVDQPEFGVHRGTGVQAEQSAHRGSPPEPGQTERAGQRA